MVRKAGRLAELDALRGLAALVVLLHHAWLMLPRTAGDGLEALDALLEETPLRVLALGRPAVIFFFVLSGYVLLRALMERPMPWPVYAAQRAARLGPPVLASVLQSWLLWHVTWSGPLPEELPGFASATWAEEPTAGAVLRQGLLLNTDPENGLNPVLWSLVHEWRIGLLLPLALLARSWPSALLAAGFVGFAVAILAGIEPNTAFLGPDIAASLLRTLYFVLAFATGAALALAGQVGQIPAPWRLAAGLTVLVAMTFSRHDLISVAGSALLILLALQRDGAAAWLHHPVPLWLGRISFSLYLVHLPVMTALLHLLVGLAPVPLIVAGSLGVALLAGALLHRWCEIPTQDLSRRIVARLPRAERDGRYSGHALPR